VFRHPGGERWLVFAWDSSGFDRKDPAGVAALIVGFKSPLSDFTVNDSKLTVKQASDLLECEEVLHKSLFESVAYDERVGCDLSPDAIFKVIGAS
jgi:hypothetical protein